MFVRIFYSPFFYWTFFFTIQVPVLLESEFTDATRGYHNCLFDCHYNALQTLECYELKSVSPGRLVGRHIICSSSFVRQYQKMSILTMNKWMDMIKLSFILIYWMEKDKTSMIIIDSRRVKLPFYNAYNVVINNGNQVSFTIFISFHSF